MKQQVDQHHSETSFEEGKMIWDFDENNYVGLSYYTNTMGKTRSLCIGQMAQMKEGSVGIYNFTKLYGENPTL